MTKLIVTLALACAATWISVNAQQAPQHPPTSADLSRDETPGKAIMRTFEFQEYDIRSAAEAMPDDKWDFRPAPGMFKSEKPEFGPAEVRTFREQVKHVACANLPSPPNSTALLRLRDATRTAPARLTPEQNCSRTSATRLQLSTSR